MDTPSTAVSHIYSTFDEVMSQVIKTRNEETAKMHTMAAVYDALVTVLRRCAPLSNNKITLHPGLISMDFDIFTTESIADVSRTITQVGEEFIRGGFRDSDSDPAMKLGGSSCKIEWIWFLNNYQDVVLITGRVFAEGTVDYRVVKEVRPTDSYSYKLIPRTRNRKKPNVPLPALSFF